MEQVAASEQALTITLQWLRRRFQAQFQVAVSCMQVHAVIIGWTTALLALIEILDSEVVMAFCIFDIPSMLSVTSEVISSMLCLPDYIFCPLVLWAARRLNEDVWQAKGIIDRTPATHKRRLPGRSWTLL